MNLLKAIGGILPGAAQAGIQAATGNWLGAASSVANTLGGFFSAQGAEQTSREAEDRAYQRNLAMMREQNDFNVNMWRQTNEYNAPSNQLQLLRDAGINPAMYDFGSGGSQASELTAASGDVPYNSDIGQYSDPAEKVLQTLTFDAQIAKLRNEIKYQQLLNRDYEMLVNAHGMELMRPGDPFYEDSQDGVVVYSDRPRNYYERQMLDQRDDRIDVFLNRALRKDEYEVYHDTKGILKQMSRKQLRNLEEELRSKILNNSLTEEDVNLMQKYGISSRDQNEWTALIRATLRNPDAVYNIIDRLIDAGSRTIERSGQKFINMFKGTGNSHKNVW